MQTYKTIGPEPCGRGLGVVSLRFFGLLFGRCGGVDHGLQDASAGVDEPVVDLQQRQVGLRRDVPLLVLAWVRVLQRVLRVNTMHYLYVLPYITCRLSTARL